MAPLLLELSTLEVEALEIAVDTPALEQESSLDTLTSTLDDIDVAAILTGTVIQNAKCCCCCTFSFCCCCPY